MVFWVCWINNSETFEKCSILLKAKKGENFNHPSTIYRTYGTGRHTMGISRIKLKLHFVQNVEPDAGIGQKGAFFKGLILSSNSFIAKPKLSHFFWVIDVSAVNDDRFFQKNLYRTHIEISEFIPFGSNDQCITISD